jgi:two-component system, OmpR family, phosphate regulon sensor histidine kinase PhoR
MAGLRNRVWTVFRGDRPMAASGGYLPDEEDDDDEEDTVSGRLADILSDAVTDGVLRVDSAGRVTAANPAACRLFDIADYPPPPGRMIGQTVLEATHLRSLAELCAEAQRTGILRETDVRQVGRAERTLRARAIPLTNERGTLLLLTDQTELIRLRTVRTEFVANVSHELRTPLASIRATAETLLDGAISDPEYSRKFLETIIREANRLVGLSSDLLELSRAESRVREKTPFDLRELITEIGARLTGQAERRKITLSLPPAAPPVEIIADRHEIDQVFFNLIDNAIKYTPESGRVTVRLEILPDAERVKVVVEDTGIGILSQDLPRIFERFWRADRARRFQSGEGAGNGGTGLGLSIVKHIVEAHGGVVTAESELGQGSRFSVLLPLPSSVPISTVAPNKITAEPVSGDSV